LPDEFTLAQLAERLDMQPRTVRSYIEQGLLRGPEVGGRGARYSEYHATRLLAIRTLKELRGLPLAEVRRRLLVITGPEIASLAKEAEAARGFSVPNDRSALNYLRSINQGRLAKDTAEPGFTSSPEAPTPMDVLLERLDRLTEGKHPSRRSRGEVWTSIPITPDVEIRVRGRQTADELARWERIADHLRQILMGGSKEEQ
jgi:DNA-binding transcriptional MerR regulator